jgi:CheY-like chemotaxis protein
VRVYSEEGQGTTMCLYFPRFYGEADWNEDAHNGQGMPHMEGNQTVLVVDDEPTIRMLVCEVLEEMGCSTIEAGDGAAALQLLQSDVRIDLLVTDIGLPGSMNGRQVADAARALRPDLGVLIITGYAENAVVGNGPLEPGMELVTKPFAMETFGARVRDMLDR